MSTYSRFVDFETVYGIPGALAHMRDGWHLSSASWDGKQWVFLLGKPLILGLEYDHETETYEDGGAHGRRLP